MRRRTSLTPPAPDSSGEHQRNEKSSLIVLIRLLMLPAAARASVRDNSRKTHGQFGCRLDFRPPGSYIIPHVCGIVNSIVKKSLCRAGAAVAWAWLAVACFGCAALRRVGNRLFAGANSRPRAKKKRAARLRLKLTAGGGGGRLFGGGRSVAPVRSPPCLTKWSVLRSFAAPRAACSRRVSRKVTQIHAFCIISSHTQPRAPSASPCFCLAPASAAPLALSPYLCVTNASRKPFPRHR